MRSALRLIAPVVVSIALSLTPRSAAAVDLMVYKATLKIVAGMVVSSMIGPDTVVMKKLGNNEIINLALGQPLGTKVAPLILAGVGDFEPRMTNSPVEKVIVLDPSQNGNAQLVATVAVANSLTYQGAEASKATGFGFGGGTILTTTLGNPSQNGFISTTVTGSATGSGAHLGVVNGNIVFPAISGTGTMSGPIKFNFTDKNNSVVNFDGIIVKAQGKVSGKPIGTLTE